MQRAAALLNFVALVAVEGARRHTRPELDDLRGLAWFAETMKEQADVLEGILFPKSPPEDRGA